MIDKIVGDAIHAIFNAPFALEDHPRRAVASALALLEATEEVRRSPLGQRLQLGRTRVGIETGPAIVGDVGGSRKLDYTAHGNAMNAAARLEAANKDLGSSHLHRAGGRGAPRSRDGAPDRHAYAARPERRDLRVYARIACRRIFGLRACLGMVSDRPLPTHCCRQWSGHCSSRADIPPPSCRPFRKRSSNGKAPPFRPICRYTRKRCASPTWFCRPGT